MDGIEVVRHMNFRKNVSNVKGGELASGEDEVDDGVDESVWKLGTRAFGVAYDSRSEYSRSNSEYSGGS